MGRQGESQGLRCPGAQRSLSSLCLVTQRLEQRRGRREALEQDQGWTQTAGTVGSAFTAGLAEVKRPVNGPAPAHASRPRLEDAHGQHQSLRPRCSRKASWGPAAPIGPGNSPTRREPCLAPHAAHACPALWLAGSLAPRPGLRQLPGRLRIRWAEPRGRGGHSHTPRPAGLSGDTVPLPRKARQTG